MNIGVYITLGILIIIMFYVISQPIYKKLKRYQISIKKIEPKKKVVKRKKKKKSLWIKVI